MTKSIAEISVSREEGVVTVRLAGEVIGTVADRDTIIRQIDRVIKGNGWVRITGFSPANRETDTLIANAAQMVG